MGVKWHIYTHGLLWPTHKYHNQNNIIFRCIITNIHSTTLQVTLQVALQVALQAKSLSWPDIYIFIA